MIDKDGNVLYFQCVCNVALRDEGGQPIAVIEISRDITDRKLTEKALIRVPMLNRDWLTYYKKELGCEYLLDPTHKIEYTMDSLREELSKAGFKIECASVQFAEIWAVVRNVGKKLYFFKK